MPQKQRLIVRPRFSQVRDEIAANIANGRWKPGTLIPAEVQLANEHGVSQGTLRKALDLLEADKLVVRHQGRGRLVVDHDTEEMAIRFGSTFGTHEQRIGGHVTQCAAEFGDPTGEEREKLAIGPREQVLRSQRVRVHHDMPFMFEVATLVRRHFPGIGLADVRNARLAAIAQDFGVHIDHGVERVSAIMCPGFALAKLGLATPAPILLLQRTVFKRGGVPLEFRMAWCHLRDTQDISVAS